MRIAKLASAVLICSGAAIALASNAALADTRSAQQFAIGAAPAWEARNDYGQGSRMNFVPELLGFLYMPTSHDRYHLRVGARVGFSGLSQPDMPVAVQLQEWDVRPGVEVGVVRDGPVIPVFAVGVGAVARQMNLTTQAPVADVEASNAHNEILARAYAHAALGVPFGDGRVVVEPFGRYEIIVGDNRSAWRFGLDVSVLLF